MKQRVARPICESDNHLRLPFREVLESGLVNVRRTKLKAGKVDNREAQILARVRAIPKGFVQAYSDIDPHAPRFVGHVLATTTAKVPWHRVVRSDGSIAQGKRQLQRLREEGVPIKRNRVDMVEARLPGDLFRLAAGETGDPCGGNRKRRQNSNQARIRANNRGANSRRYN